MRRFVFGAICFILVVITAAWFTLQRADIPYAKLQQQYALSASKFVTLESGANVHYLESEPASQTGITEQKTLLLLHGYTSSSFEWSEWFRVLRGQYRIIAVDLPMHGLTETDYSYVNNPDGMVTFIDEFTTAVDLERFSIGGTALGGHISLRYTLAHPEQIEALVLVGSEGWPSKDDDTAFDPISFDIQSDPKLAPILKYLDMETFIKARMEKCFSNPDLVDEFTTRRFADLARAPGHRKGLIRLALNEVGFVTNTQLSEIAVPTLILQGEKDQIIPARFARQFYSAIPNAALITYEMSGHCLSVETPRRSLDDTLSFLDTYRRPEHNSTEQALESIPLDGQPLDIPTGILEETEPS